MGGTLLPTVPGQRARGDRAPRPRTPTWRSTPAALILVGERLATVPGALTAAVRLAETTGARLAWVPRRAGDRGAVETGCLPNLFPGGRPVADAAARVDLGAAWGVEKLPEAEGLDADGILDALVAGDLRALVVGGVDPADVPALHGPGRRRSARRCARRSWWRSRCAPRSFTELADVVFPVRADHRQGRLVRELGGPGAAVRPQVLESPTSLSRRARARRHRRGARPADRGPDTGAGRAPRWRRWARGRASGSSPEIEPVEITDGVVDQARRRGAGGSGLVLASRKQLIDDGRMQDGDDHYRATARRAVVLVNQSTFDSLAASGGISEEGDLVTLTGPLGSLDLPVGVADLVDGAVWAPASAPGLSVRHLRRPGRLPGDPGSGDAAAEGGSK